MPRCAFGEPYGLEIRQSAELFINLINKERGGLNIAGETFTLLYSGVEDFSSNKYVARATSTAYRWALPFTSDVFVLAPYSSTLTPIASAQAALDGRIMMATAAATPSAVSSSNSTFGMLAAGSDYMKKPIQKIVQAAAAVDNELWPGREPKEGYPNHYDFCVGDATTRDLRLRCRDHQLNASDPCRGGLGRCLDSLKVGFFLSAESAFRRGVCVGAAGHAAAAGLVRVDDGDLTMPVEQTDAAYEDALRALQKSGANVLIACTTSGTAKMTIKALEAIDWTPLAVATTSSVGVGTYGQEVSEGFWEGEHIIGPAFWYHTVDEGRDEPTRGEFSHMTSEEFFTQYQEAYRNEAVSYVGAAAFAGLASLSKAIEDSVVAGDPIPPESVTTCVEICEKFDVDLASVDNTALGLCNFHLADPNDGSSLKTFRALMLDMKERKGLFGLAGGSAWASVPGRGPSVYLQIIQFQAKARCHRRPRIGAPSALLT